MATVYSFVKLFENRQFATEFVSGKLFMNTIKFFNKYSDKAGELRGDDYEGIVALFQPNRIGEIRIGNLMFPGNSLASPITIQTDHLLNKNAFCLYSLNSSGFDLVSSDTIADFKRTIELHESCFGLGDYCVVILNAQEFIDRCHNAIKKIGISGTLGLVDYFNERDFHGYLPTERLGYQKRSVFSHQREYRILIDTERSVPGSFVLEIGSLADIVHITTPVEFNKQLIIKLPHLQYV